MRLSDKFVVECNGDGNGCGGDGEWVTFKDLIWKATYKELANHDMIERKWNAVGRIGTL